MTFRKRTFREIIPAIALVAMLQGTLFAQLNGHNLRGDYGLQSGSQAAPGWYGSLLYLNYNIDTVRDRNGDALSTAGGDINVQAGSPILMRVTDQQIWGANYGFLVAPSWTNNKLDSPLLSATQKTDTGFGDLYVQPINLGWHTDRFDYVAGLGVFAPTGKYNDGGDDNVGLGMWSFEFFGGATYYIDTQKTWHASVLASYETHTEKEDSDTRVGDILTLEGGIGKSFMEGAINVGGAYFAQWKLTDDDFGGLVPAGRIGRHKIFGAGPEVTVPVFANDKAVGLFGARYFWEFGTESMTEGEMLLITFTLAMM